MLDLVDARDHGGPVPLQRPVAHLAEDAASGARDIVADVRLRGDAAVLEYTARFDGIRLSPEGIRVDPADIAATRSMVAPGLLAALTAMAAACRHAGERSLRATWIDRSAGGVVGELVRPVRRAGVYVPAGRKGNPAAVITGVVPAQVAGVDAIAVCSPPSASGEIPVSTLAACAVVGVNEVYRIGGAQAIAALAYGTESVRPVEKVVGRGGRFVSSAQGCVRGWVGSGPESGASELVIVADETSSPRTIALDLMANAAMGPAGTHVVVTAAEGLLDDVVSALNEEVTSIEGSEDVENALIEGGRGILVRDLDHAVQTANAFAPQYLMLQIADAEAILAKIRNAGTVLLGGDAPVAALPLLSGTGGVLPTGGSARWDSGLAPRDFVKTIPLCGADASRLREATAAAEAVAEAQGSPADRLALYARLSS
jgi:histidinol dehydrogenase